MAEVSDGRYVVERLIAENEVTCMFGLPKSGKSFLALKLACDIVNGTPFFDLPTMQGDVLYIDAEDEQPAWRRRVGKIVRGYRSIDPPKAMTRLKKSRQADAQTADEPGRSGLRRAATTRKRAKSQKKSKAKRP